MMNERQERIELLAGRWLAARTSEAEERELRGLLREERDLPDSLRDLAMLFAGFEALGAEKMAPGSETGGGTEKAPSKRGAPQRRAMPVPGEKVRPSYPWRRRLLWSTAAAAVVALGLLLGIELWRKPYCYIDGRPVYDREVALRTTAYFDAFSALELPDRLVDELIENP